MALTGILFLFIYLAGLVMAFARHPRFGLYAYLLAFYGYPPGRWWGDFLPDLRWSLLAAIVTFIASLRLKPEPDQQSWISQPIVKILIVFTAWLWIQNAWALYPDVHLEVSILFTKYLILFYMMARILNTEEEIYRFSLAHVIGSFYFGWLAFSAGTGGRFEDIGSPGLNDANILAAHMVTALFFGAILLFRTKGLVRIAVILMIPFILNTIILTQSRSAFLALVVGGAVLFLYKPKHFSKVFYALSGLALVLFFYLAHDFFWERVATITQASDETEIDNSAKSRIVLMKAQWEMWKRSPILGHGHRGTAALSTAYLDEKYLSWKDGVAGRRSSHNTFLTFLVEQGILGVLIYFLIIFWVIRSVRSLKGIEADPELERLSLYRAVLAGSLAAFLVSGQFVDLLKVETQFWYLLMLSQVMILARRQHVQVEKPKVPREYV